MLDLILTLLLIVVLPLRALLQARVYTENARSTPERYRTTIVVVAMLLALLALAWAIAGRSIIDLGLDMPATPAAWAGLIFAAALLATLGILIKRETAPTDANRERPRRESMPETPAERQLFLVLSVAVGCGWELLYRGFLLFYLPPITGLPVALGVAATAYGLAHGFENLKSCALSILVALIFAGSYVVTGSLWWLMLLHTGLPLLGLLQKPAADATR